MNMHEALKLAVGSVLVGAHALTLVLGAGFAAGGHTGLLLTIALAIEYLFVRDSRHMPILTM